MNRIRKYKNGYQVLITPHNINDPTGLELMIGGWTDSSLRNYEIKEFKTYDDALCETYKYGDIPWEKIVMMHKDSYEKLYKLVRHTVHEIDTIMDFEPLLMTPEMLKNVMFDRVMINGNRFTLNYNMNDIISFNISNPWSRHLTDIKKK